VQRGTLAGGSQPARHAQIPDMLGYEREVRMADRIVTFEGLSLPVTSLDRSVPFYQSLGFRLEIRTDQFALLRLGSGTLGLLELGRASGLESGIPSRLRALVQIELSTPDLDGLFAHLTGAGVQIAVPPRDRGFERSMQCRDPDGFTVEFAEGHRGHNATNPDAIARQAPRID
jgi:catechol 2,3-dioxygenase-like lactoylglutathione lyase family enzyme